MQRYVIIISRKIRQRYIIFSCQEQRTEAQCSRHLIAVTCLILLTIVRTKFIRNIQNILIVILTSIVLPLLLSYLISCFSLFRKISARSHSHFSSTVILFQTHIILISINKHVAASHSAINNVLKITSTRIERRNRKFPHCVCLSLCRVTSCLRIPY